MLPHARGSLDAKPAAGSPIPSRRARERLTDSPIPLTFACASPPPPDAHQGDGKAVSGNAGNNAPVSEFDRLNQRLAVEAHKRAEAEDRLRKLEQAQQHAPAAPAAATAIDAPAATAKPSSSSGNKPKRSTPPRAMGSGLLPARAPRPSTAELARRELERREAAARDARATRATKGSGYAQQAAAPGSGGKSADARARDRARARKLAEIRAAELNAIRVEMQKQVEGAIQVRRFFSCVSDVFLPSRGLSPPHGASYASNSNSTPSIFTLRRAEPNLVRPLLPGQFVLYY